MWLGVEGVVGAGKTTTATLAGRLAGIDATLERSDEHPFLDSYYLDPPRYAVETELAFMLLQYSQMRDSQNCEHVISDFAPAKNLVFARLVCLEEDLSFLEAADAFLWGRLGKPDLTVFLDPPIAVCHSRIQTRGRSYEEGLNTADLERIRTAYLGHLATLGAEVATLELAGDETPDEVARMVLHAGGIGG